MEKIERLEPHSFGILVIMFTVGTSILIGPSGLATDAKQDAWMAGLLGGVINVALVYLYVVLGDRYPGQTLVQYCRTALGTWFGKLVGAAFVGFFYLLTSLMVGDLGMFFTAQIMYETPVEMFIITFAAVILFGFRTGMKALAYASEIFVLFMAVLFVLMMSGLSAKYQVDHILPMLEFGVMPVLKGAYSYYGLQEMVVLLMLYPYVSEGVKRRRSLIAGTAIGSVFLVVTTISSILVMGHPLTANELFPAYVLAKHLSIGKFFERVEGMMMLIWVMTIFVKTAITFHASVLGTAQLFEIDDEKPLSWPLAIGLVVIALVSYPNAVYVHELLAVVWPVFATLFLLLLPLLLLSVSAFRQARRHHSIR